MTIKACNSGRRPALTCASHQQAGLSLVELMISLVIGLVILAALVAIFVNTSRNNRESATASSVIENGRFAIEMLEGDIVHAGYWGTYAPDFDDPTRDVGAPTSTPFDVPDPCAAFDPAIWTAGSAYVDQLIGMPVQAFSGTTTVCSGVIDHARRVPGTDVLVVRHAARCTPGEPGDCATDTDDPLPANSMVYIQSTLCDEELIGPPPHYAFGRTPTTGRFDPPFTLRRRTCVETPTLPEHWAEKRRFMSYIYWVRDFAVTAGDGVPTLVRSEFGIDPSGTLGHQPPVALVEGVDGMWVELGIDRLSITPDFVRNGDPIDWEDPDTRQRAVNRGDGVPDVFVRCNPECTGAPPAAGDATPPPVDDLSNVTAVRVYLLARSREPSQGYVDSKTYTAGAAGPVGPFAPGFKRHMYSTTVRLPNVSGRRERP